MEQGSHLTIHRDNPRPRGRSVLWITVLAGLLFTLIGARFLLVPDGAAKTFGLASRLSHELHYVVGLRDLWLAGLAIALAVLHEWRALMLWFALGSLVCFADGAIVGNSSGNPWAAGFHWGSGVFCLALAWASWRLARRVHHQE